jgi:hypothetical protein
MYFSYRSFTVTPFIRVKSHNRKETEIMLRRGSRCRRVGWTLADRWCDFAFAYSHTMLWIEHQRGRVHYHFAMTNPHYKSTNPGPVFQIHYKPSKVCATEARRTTSENVWNIGWTQWINSEHMNRNKALPQFEVEHGPSEGVWCNNV